MSRLRVRPPGALCWGCGCGVGIPAWLLGLRWLLGFRYRDKGLEIRAQGSGLGIWVQDFGADEAPKGFRRTSVPVLPCKLGEMECEPRSIDSGESRVESRA